MCGIIGYVGSNDTADVLMNGLSGLEYRGYDSAGIAVVGPTLAVYKEAGELSALEETVSDLALDGTVGIGHTRWSTHGPPTDTNAHPHVGCRGRCAVVHNGIVENYRSLRDELIAAGHTFDSDTDTEVVPHLIESALEEGADRETAFRAAISRLEGSYAIAAVFEGEDAVYAARHHSPLVVGLGEKGTYLASDVPAFIEYTERVMYLDDGEFARLTADDVVVTDSAGRRRVPTVERIDWSPEEAGKSGFDHYMLKEIYEQPTSIRQCLRGRVGELAGTVELEEFTGLEPPTSVHLVACGTSYHAGLYGAYLLREVGVPTQTFLASEYDAETIPTDDGTLVIGITQSGETADTLGALRTANRTGATTLALTNVVASSAARECDHVIYIRAGPEIGVAATKTFVSQQVTLALVAATLGTNVSHVATSEVIGSLRDLPDQIQTVLDESRARPIAETYADADAFFFIGRGLQVPVALEGALKMKEITYKHAEGFAAGELKHGPLALVTENTPTIALLSGSEDTVRKTLGNVSEVDARGAPIIAVADSRRSVDRYAECVLEVPNAHRWLTPILVNVQLQLIAYWVAHELGREIDKPRNLAKSVTVE